MIGTDGQHPRTRVVWQPDHGLLIVGDALSDNDVGWVDIATDGPDAAATAVASLQRLTTRTESDPPGARADTDRPAAAFTAGLSQAQRLVDDPVGAIRYGARRILGFALSIRDGIPSSDIHTYVQTRPWAVDTARALGITVHEFTADLIDSMLRSGAITKRDNRFHASADHIPVTAESLRVPFPADWSNLALISQPTK